MNFLNQAKSALGGGAAAPAAGATDPAAAGAAPAAGGAAPAAGAAPGAATGQQDALDKGVDSALKHFGHGQSVSTTETISDGVRTAFKSTTGRDIPIQDKQ